MRVVELYLHLAEGEAQFIVNPLGKLHRVFPMMGFVMYPTFLCLPQDTTGMKF